MRLLEKNREGIHGWRGSLLCEESQLHVLLPGARLECRRPLLPGLHSGRSPLASSPGVPSSPQSSVNTYPRHSQHHSIPKCISGITHPILEDSSQEDSKAGAPTQKHSQEAQRRMGMWVMLPVLLQGQIAGKPTRRGVTFWLGPHRVGRLGELLYKNANPTLRLHVHDLVTLKGPTPHAIMFGVRISTYEFGGRKNSLHNSELTGDLLLRRGQQNSKRNPPFLPEVGKVLL